MTFPTFSPPIPPSPNSTIQKNYRVNAVKFGDGYEQRSGDGLNAVSRTLTLVWNIMLASEIAYCDMFFDNLAGITPFYYAWPAGAPTYKWILDPTNSQNYVRTALTSNTNSLQIILKQTFDLDS